MKQYLTYRSYGTQKTVLAALLLFMPGLIPFASAQSTHLPLSIIWGSPGNTWMWGIFYLLCFITVLITIIYFISRAREKQVLKEIKNVNRGLSLILKTSQTEAWVMHVKDNTFDEYGENGEVVATYEGDAFYQKVAPNNVETLRNAVKRVVAGETSRVETDLRTIEGNIYHICIGIVSRDEQGRPAELLGTRTNIDDEVERRKMTKEALMKYQAVFQGAPADIVTYDKQGRLEDVNQFVLEKMKTRGIEGVKAMGITVQKVLGLSNTPPEKIQKTHYTQIFLNSNDDTRVLNRLMKQSKFFYEQEMVPVKDENGNIDFFFGTGFDRTESALAYEKIIQYSKDLKNANKELDKFNENLNYVMHNGGIRLVEYTLATHMLTIYGGVGEVEFDLTPTHIFSILEESSYKAAASAMTAMDKQINKPLEFEVKTKLRAKGRQLCLQFSFVPGFDRGVLNFYYGMCRDISEIKDTESKLRQETIKAQDVENVKDAFLHNMTTEIQTPLNAVVSYSEQFQKTHNVEDEKHFFQEIKDNTNRLLRLVNDILYLSQLDAHMIEFEKKPVDITAMFEDTCRAAWASHKQPDVAYLIDNHFSNLVVESDFKSISTIITQIASNAAKFTKNGKIEARFEYAAHQLIIVMKDTGCGIAKNKQNALFNRFIPADQQGTGLGLSICHEIAKQMGGSISIDSEEDKGTTVWVVLPCHALEQKRK